MDGGFAGEAPPTVGYDGLVAALDGLFARVDALPDSALAVETVEIAGVGFSIRSSNAERLARHRRRLAGGAPAPGSPLRRIDFVAARDLGWPSPRWEEPGWQMHLFDQRVAAGGYWAGYPYFERQWHVARIAGGDALHILDSWDDLLPWDGGAPFRLALHFAFRAGRRRMIHAGSLGLGGRGVLLAGPGGAGKSGTTLAGLAHGLTTVGDDYVLLDLDGRPAVRPLYRLIKQDAAGLARCGLAGRFADLPRNWQGKVEFDPETVFEGAMAPRLDLAAILLPTRGGGARSRLDPVPRAEAARLLKAALLDEVPTSETETLLLLVRLASTLPVYRLHLSEDPAEIAATIRSVIEHAR